MTIPKDAETIVIDTTLSFNEMAEKVIRQLSGPDRREAWIKSTAGRLADMVNGVYRMAWGFAIVPIKMAGMVPEEIEAARQLVLFGAWEEVLSTLRPGDKIVVKGSTDAG